MSAGIISKVPLVLAYLADTFTASSLLGAATPPVTVWDGPVATEAAPGLVLWTGLDDPDSDAATLAADSERRWGPSLGGQGEVITIYCAAESWSGGTDIRTERVAAYGVVSVVEALVRSDATGFGGNGLVADPGVTGGQLRQNNTSRGAQARVSFQIILNTL